MPWPGSPIFFSWKFDLIYCQDWVTVRCSMSPVHKYCQDWVTVRCSMSHVPIYCPKLGHSSLLNVSCAQIIEQNGKTAQTSNTAQLSNTAQTEQHGSNWATNERCGKRTVLWAMAFAFTCWRDKTWKQAGAELGQAQLKLGLDFNSINLNKNSVIVLVE